MTEKNAAGPEKPTQEWIEDQCRQFEELLSAFTAEMRAAFRRRAEEGRDRWQDAAQADRLQMDLLAHAYYRERCEGEEAHVANFAAFLWGIRMRKREQGLASAREKVRAQ